MKLLQYLVLSLIFLQIVLANLSPIIIIPGIGGNQLQAHLDNIHTSHFVCSKNSDWFRIWFSLHNLLPFYFDCFIDNFKLQFNAQNNQLQNKDGVQIKVENFGSTSSLEYLVPYIKFGTSDYFHTFIEYFTKKGYSRNQNLFGAPYDFRLSPLSDKEYQMNLKNLIESNYYQNNQTRVTLISHSMGGLWVLHILNNFDQDWKDKFIKQWISISTPLGGSPEMMKIMASGSNLGFSWLKSSKFKPLLVAMESSYWLLPNPEVYSDVIIESSQKNYTSKDIPQLLEDLQIEHGRDIFDNIKQFNTNLHAPKVDTYTLFGSGIPTAQRYIYGNDLTQEPNIILGDGDGTVHIQSLMTATKWNDQQQQLNLIKQFPGINHQHILKDPQSLQYIFNLVQLNNQ